jgi:hypothetical protein
MDALCDKAAFAHRVLDGELKVRERLDESGKEPRPCLRVKRGRLQTRGSVGDLIPRTDVGLGRVVAFVEDLDPPAGDGLVCVLLR